MEQLKGALLFGQSGGPSSVINASACGVFEEAFKHECITAVYGAAHGIKGILDDYLYDISQEDKNEIALLRNTPSSALGSVRYKLKSADVDDTDYKRILEVFTKYNIRYFFYNGGNDSMDTCYKVGKFLTEHNYECRIIGVPKTIDNDLACTDHCPGYGSAAKYIATTCMELALDSRVYDKPTASVVEIMGRNAGWLTAASAIASYSGNGPDLIYVPENAFVLEDFLSDVDTVFRKQNNCIVAVSEGVKDKDGRYLSEFEQTGTVDSFGHAQLGGAGTFLSNQIKYHMGIKVRDIEFSLMQRCAAHIGSKTDMEEAYAAGQAAVQHAVAGKSNVMMGFERVSNNPYKMQIVEIPLADVANYEKKLPSAYYTSNFIDRQFLNYALPLINGEARPPFENGVPRFANLKKIRVID